MTGPVIKVSPSDLWAHGSTTTATSTDYRTPYSPDVPGSGWPSEQAYRDAHQSMGRAGDAFADRQEERGKAVNAAGDGLSGQDSDASKLMQGVGAIMGPLVQGGAAMLQGIFGPGAQALAGLWQGASSMMGQVAGRLTPETTPHKDGPKPDAGAGMGGAASGAPVTGSSLPPTGQISHSEPPKDKRDEGKAPEVVSAVAISPGMGGMGGMPMGRSTEGGGKPIALGWGKKIVTDQPKTAGYLPPVTAQAQVEET